jgi:hypothetical protein
MGWKCFVPGCTSGYSNYVTIEGTQFFRLPLNNSTLLKKWLQRTLSESYIPTENSRICSLHFVDSDFSYNSLDTNKSRKRRRQSLPLNTRHLVPLCIPSVFPFQSSPIISSSTSARTQKALASTRLNSENQNILNDISKLHEADTVKDLDDLVMKFTLCDTKPQNFYIHPSILSSQQLAIFINVDCMSSPPQLLHSVRVNRDLTFEAFSNNRHISVKSLSISMLHPSKIRKFSDFLNLLASLNGESLKFVSPEKQILSILKSCLQGDDNEDDECVRRYAFWHEQIKLSELVPTQRHYSSTLLVSCLLWHSASPACYRTILSDKLLLLPSERTLRSLSKSLSVESRDSILAYLRARREKLNEFEGRVMLLFDEIYVYQRLDYAQGHFYGLSENGLEPCTSVLCFMIKSLASKYEDVISMIPITGMSITILERHFKPALQLAIDAGFYVVGSTCDNHPVNRHYLKNYLGNGELAGEVDHPLSLDQPFFVLLDPTHNMKNVYNCFQKKKVFQLPSFGDHPPVTADFKHVEALYNIESDSSLRMAHKLTATILNPSSIQRASAKLVWGLLDDSTIAAFKFFVSEYHKPWEGTSFFLAIMSNLSKILNVKSCSIGLKKRDQLRQPILSADDWKLSELDKYADFFRRWKMTGQKGLTSETFAAVTLMCDTLPRIAKYLISSCDYHYVLLGSLQSDPLESRFGRYRQLHGANFFISFRQICESEKKIKISSALQHSGLHISDLQKCSEANEVIQEEMDPQACSVAVAISFDMEVNDNETNIIFYVAGYISNTLSDCASCIQLLRQEKQCPSAEEDDETREKPSIFLSFINRGGLKCPSSYLYEVCLLAYIAFCEIKSKCSTFEVLLRARNSALLFSDAVFTKLTMTDHQHLTSGHCEKFHLLNVLIRRCLQRLFNILAKKLINDMTRSKSESNIRKIAKLSSTTT